MANQLKNINLQIEQINPLNTPPLLVKGINIHIALSNLPSDLTTTEKQNNSNNYGFNDWDYRVKAPEDIQIQQYIEVESSYTEIIQSISDHTEISGTVASGLLTDYELNV